MVDGLPIFVSETACKIVTESLNFCHRPKDLRINASVLIPTHGHAILLHADFQAKALAQVGTDMRKSTGRRRTDCCTEHMPACFASVRTERANGDRARRLGPPTRHPVPVETEGFWQARIDDRYHHPLRKGLVRAAEHGRFSSASDWALGGKIENHVLPSAVGELPKYRWRDLYSGELKP